MTGTPNYMRQSRHDDGKMTKEEAIDVLKDILEEATSDEDAVCYVTSEDVKAFNMAIEALSADRQQGEWVIRENGNKECSFCKHERQDGWDYFCGYCGARMKAR